MSSKRGEQPSQKELQEWFFYDPETGFLHWKQRPSNNVMWGEQAGTVSSRGYLFVRFKGVLYKQHNFVWIMHNGDIPEGLTVDHKNWNRADNRLDNLRLATPRQQAIHKLAIGFSRKIACTLRPWMVETTVDRRKIYIGNFSTALQARLAYERHINQLEPEFASSLLTDALKQFCSEGTPTVWTPDIKRT